MSTVILCPHQDDEILSSFLLISLLRNLNETVKIVFATNGDYMGREIACTRYNESISALSLCGITSKDIFYMGYSDTGMRKPHSFLYRLYYAKLEQKLESPCSCCTYHPANGETIHHALFGEEADYTKANFIADLRAVLYSFSPRRLIIPSVFDTHWDHRSLAIFVREQIKKVKINTFSYLIHSGDDLQWPQRQNEAWSCPPSLTEKIWNNRFIVYNPRASLLKKKAIKCFQSQKPEAQNGFLLSFAKREELFFSI